MITLNSPLSVPCWSPLETTTGAQRELSGLREAAQGTGGAEIRQSAQHSALSSRPSLLGHSGISIHTVVALHLELVIEIPQKPLTIRSLSRKALSSWQPRDYIPSPASSWQPLSARAVGQMALQLMLRDAGQLCLPVPVSPSHGYTVAFKWQQGTSGWDGNVKLEACDMLETPT